MPFSFAAKTTSGVPNRYDGIVVLVEILFSNKSTGDKIRYEYRPNVLLYTSSKTVEVVYRSYPTTRTLLDRHGIQVLFLVSGTLGVFRFQQLLVQLTTSLALYKIASLIVDTLAVRILPQRKHYFKYKFEDTLSSCYCLEFDPLSLSL